MRFLTLPRGRGNAVTTFSVSAVVVLFGLLVSAPPALAADVTGTSSVTTFDASTPAPEFVVETTTGTSIADQSNFLIGVYPAGESSDGWAIEPSCSFVYGLFPACGISKAEYKEPSGAWTDMTDSMVNVQDGPNYYIGWGGTIALGTMFRFTFAADTFTTGAVGEYELRLTAYGSDPAAGDDATIPLSIPGDEEPAEQPASSSSLPVTGFSAALPVALVVTVMSLGAVLVYSRRTSSK